MQFETLLNYEDIAERLNSECAFSSWDDIYWNDRLLLKLKLQYYMVVKILIELNILSKDYNGKFVKFDKKSVSEGFLPDHIWEVGDCLCELKDNVYSACGWKKRIYEIDDWVENYKLYSTERLNNTQLYEKYFQTMLDETEQVCYGGIIRKTFQMLDMISPTLYIVENQELAIYLNQNNEQKGELENFIRKLIHKTNHGVPYNLIIPALTTNQLTKEKFISSYVEFYEPASGEEISSCHIELSHLLRIGLLKCALDLAK